MKLETIKHNNKIKEYYLFFNNRFLQNFDDIERVKIYIENMVNKFDIQDYLNDFNIKTTTKKFHFVDYKNETLLDNNIETFFKVLN